ncbi:MAG: DUF4012 domain-containing protein [Chloroflexi bacterium]|nr:DUF4012 domain-containing protein [Chloroflexota bacterium]
MNARRNRGTLRLGVLALALALVVMLGWKGLRVAEAAGRAQQDAGVALAALNAVQEHPMDAAGLAAAAPAFEAAARSLGALQAELQPIEPLLGLTRVLPSQASWLANVPDALAVAVSMTHVGATLAGPLAVALADGVGQGQLARSLQAVDRLAPALPDLADELDRVEPALARLRGRPLGGPLRQLGPAVERAAALWPVARQGLEALSVVGPALGMDGPRSYLLLGQNSGEIRASGGFIGSVGVLTVDQGAVVRFEYGSGYDVDPGVAVPPAPAPLARYLGLGGWYLRDANWWPDFPTTAAQVEQAWQRAGHGPVDGVIAFDTTVVEALLRAVGPLAVPGYGTVEADNFERLAVEQLYSPGAVASASSYHAAKATFLAPVGRALLARLLEVSPSELLPLGKALVQLLDAKHLQLAFKDQRLLRVVHARGWAGAMPAVDGDSLYVVDTTVSYGDTYSFVQSEVRLQMRVREDERVAHDLALRYANVYPRGLPVWMPPLVVSGGTFDLATGKLLETPGFWGDWLRVYLPPDAREVAVDGLADQSPPRQEFGRTLVEGYLPLSPGQQRTVRLRYVTSLGAVGAVDAYRLFLQKQAGVECRATSVVLLWPRSPAASYQGCPSHDGWIELRDAGRRESRKAPN